MDNFARAENLLAPDALINGTNTTFFVQNIPVAPGGFQRVVVDNALVTPAGYVPTEVVGQITFTVAPTTSVFASYYYYLFADATWTEFIAGGLQLLNLSTGNPIIDVPLVPEGLLAVLKTYASAFFCYRIAKQTALWYNQRLQERVEDRDDVSKKWQALGDKSLAAANLLRDEFYHGAGTEHAPAFAIVEHQPRVWTPYR
ncbi:MAG: hypothetical protein ACREQ5_11555 [Candidatus Dormibacteria bacterium]